MCGAAGTTVASCNAFQTCEEFPQEIRGLVQTRTAEIESGMHIHAESWQRTAQRPGLIVLYGLIGGLHDACGRNPKPIVERVLERLHALVQNAQIDARYLRSKAHGAARHRRYRSEVTQVLGQRKGRERAEAHVIATDRQQHDVDGALAELRRAPGLADAPHRELRAAAGVNRQCIACALRASAATKKIAQLIELRADLAEFPRRLPADPYRERGPRPLPP